MRASLIAGLIAVALVSQVGAQGVAGNGVLTGVERLNIHGCRKGRTSVVVSVAVAADGTWQAVETTHAYQGTYTPRGKGNRVLAFTFDDPSRALYTSVLNAWADDLCGVPVTVTSATQQKAVFTLNKRRTKGSLAVVYRFTGVANGRSGRAKLTLAGKGSWQALP